MQIRTTIGIALLLCSTMATANPGPDSALAVYQNSSAEIRVEQFSSQIVKLFKKSNASDNQGIADKINVSIERAYSPARFEQHVLRAINNNLNRNERRKVIEWLDSPLGRKASLAEAIALVTANNSGMAGTIDKAKGLESQSKAALVDVVEMAAMESALQLDVSIYQKAVAAFASSASKSLTSVQDYSTFHAAAESRREAVSSLNHTFTRSLVALAYSNLSKPETKAMISFWGSPTGTRLSVALRRGIASAFEDANRIFSRDVKNIASSSTLASAD